MQDAAQHRAAIRAGHHADVYRLLLSAGAGADRPLPSGTEGAIGRAQADYESNREAAALLCEINLAVFRLRQALLAGDEADCRAQRDALTRLAQAWLYHAPLHHVAALLAPEGEA
jgi:hypothetical protein